MAKKIKRQYRAEIITIGTEITRGRIVNTNTAFISKTLSYLGFDVQFHTSCPDSTKVMRQALVFAAKRSDVVIVTGGLGPTEDDMTTEVITSMLRKGLFYSQPAIDRVLSILKESKKVATPAHLRMAALPKGATYLHNSTGMAAGYYFCYNKCIFAVLPGVPREMKAMLEGEVIPVLRQQFFKGKKNDPYFVKTFKVLGIAESQVSRAVRALKLPEKFPGLMVAYQVPFPYVHVVLETARLAKDISDAANMVRNILGAAIVAEDDERPLAKLGEDHLSRKLKSTPKVAVAESCTGGLLAAEITGAPGASKYFLGGVVCYSNESKVRDLGVNAAHLLEHGAVSEVTARAMAEGVRQRFGSDVGLAITGIAGPEGGSTNKPVGTVWLAVTNRQGTQAQRFVFKGDRDMVRQAAVAWGLRLLRDALAAYSQE